MFKKYMEKKFSKRDSKEFNDGRAFFQKLVCSWTFGLYLRLFYKIEVIGKEKLKTDRKYLIACNHISGKDPFVLVDALGLPIAYMAKQELFQTFWSRLLMDWCGAFAVNRDKLEVSTIKTAIAVKDSKWKLGIFPQGTRDASGTIHRVTRGFTVLAKASKCDILPVSIIGADKKTKGFFSGKIIVKIGDIIPCSDDSDETIKNWCSAIKELSGFEYVPE